MNVFVLDTNVLIDIFERRYPTDLFPNVAKSLSYFAQAERIIVPRDVRDELLENTDSFRWVNANPAVVHDIDEDVEASLKLVMHRCPNIIDPLSTMPRDAADPVVVAFAHAHHAHVVSEENPSGNPARRAKVPDACGVLDVPCIKLLAFLRVLLND